MAFALVTSAMLPTGVTGATTSSPLNTTGADLLIFGCASKILPTVSDSKSNTWTPLTSVNAGTAHESRCQLHYVANPTVGTNHDFSWAYAGYGSTTGFVLAFSGAATVSPFDQENGAFDNGEATSIQPGSITPTEDNELVVALATFTDDFTSGSGSINGGFTIAHQRNFSAGPCNGGLIAYLIQTSAAAANPTITAPTGPDPLSAVIASFKSAGGGGGGGSSGFLLLTADDE